MSRGPGWLQNAVLDSIRRRSTTLESLRWDLAETPGVRATAENGDLLRSWNNSLTRAVKGLAELRRLQMVDRRLECLDECVAHYPNKTLFSAKRRLRVQLLPALQQWVASGEMIPRYTTAENESFHFKSLDEGVRGELLAAWLRVEGKIAKLLGEAERADRNALLLLLAKGKAIFEIHSLKCRGAFAERLQRCLAAKLIPEPLATKLQDLSIAIIPPAEAGHLQVRSYVHGLADVSRHGGCRLKEKTVEYLDSKCPEVVRNLPGYVTPKRIPNGRIAVYDPREPKHSDQLYSLLGQTLFQSFSFLQVA